MRPRFEVNDEIKWGKLIKSFATGVNYITPGGPAIPMPRTLDELKQLCVDVGLTVVFAEHHKALVIVQPSEEAFTVRLPPKSMVEETEASLKAGDTYGVPKFYNDFYQKQLAIPTVDKNLDFHAARIGDYSIRMCT